MKEQKNFDFEVKPNAPIAGLGAAGRYTNTLGGRLNAYRDGWREAIAKADIESKIAWLEAATTAERERAKSQGGRKWTFDKVQQLAMKCPDEHTFRVKYRNAYAAMRRYRWSTLIAYNHGSTNG